MASQSVVEMAEEAAPPSARRVLAALALTMLLPSLATSIANVGLPALVEAFGVSLQAVQWVVLAYLLATTTLVVAAGRLGDIVGRRRLMLAGVGVFTMASLACALAPTLPLLVAARAVQGLGAAVMLALTLALAGEAVPKARTGAAMGLLGTMSAVGTTLGPALGGLLIGAFGWRSMFLLIAPLGLLTMALAAWALPSDRTAAHVDRAPLDAAGTLLLSLTLVVYALAMTSGGSGIANFALLAAAGAGAGLFVVIQSKAASPLLPAALLRNPVLSAGLAASVLVTTVMMATLVVGPFYLSGALGLEAAAVGLVMAAGPLVAALTGMPAGRLVDRSGAARMVLLGLVGMAVGLLVLALSPSSAGAGGYVAAIAVVTAHYALFQAANNTAVMADIPADRRGSVSGVLSLSRNLGLITGASAMGAVFSLAVGTEELATADPQAIAEGTRVVFLVATVLAAIGGAVVAVGVRRGQAPPNGTRAIR